jgi:hypothetical protein
VGKVTQAGWLVLWKGEPVQWFKRKGMAERRRQKLGPSAQVVEAWFSTGLTE